MPGLTDLTDRTAVAPGAGPYRADFWRGVVAMAPLLAGVIPFAIAFAVSARAAGFSVVETQALSMVVFAGSAQLAVVVLAAGGAGPLTIVLTTLVLNLRHVLYGLSLGTWLRRPSAGPPGQVLAADPPSWVGRPVLAAVRPPTWLSLPVLAAVLTDESYGLAIRAYRDGRGSAAFLFGASLALYVPFAVATLAGSLLGTLLPDPAGLGLDFVFPLSFLALLLPLLRTRRDLVVAAVAGIAALVLGRVIDGGGAVLLATVVAAGLGVLLDRRRGRRPR